MRHDSAQAWTPLPLPGPLRVAYARSTAPLRVAIVDADAPGRERLRRLLDASPDVELVGAGMTADEAIALAVNVRPDVMYVRVRGPERGVLSALAALDHGAPAVVVIADTGEHAFHAFETDAADYLVPPFTDERFGRSLSRARRMAGGVERRDPATVSRRGAAPGRRLIVRTPGQLTFVPLGEIDWVESAGNNVRIHAGAATHITRESMKSVEARLDERFVRVHRGAIVNADRIRRITNDGAGHPWVVLKDGTELSAGRYIEGKLREWISSAC
jgi:two-component system LytT family response regulator